MDPASPDTGGLEIVVVNKHAGEGENAPEDDQNKQLQRIEPSYQAKQNIKSVLLLSTQDSTNDVNSQYIRSRRYSSFFHSSFVDVINRATQK